MTVTAATDSERVYTRGRLRLERWEALLLDRHLRNVETGLVWTRAKCRDDGDPDGVEIANDEIADLRVVMGKLLGLIEEMEQAGTW